MARRTAGLASLLCLVAGLARCGGDARPVVDNRAAAQPPEPEAEPPSFDPASVRLQEGSAAAVIRRAIDEERFDEARALALRALEQEPELLEAGRLHWLAAEADELNARPHWAALVEMEHPLSRWAALHHAEGYLESEPAKASELLEPLSETRWAGQTRAAKSYALALVGEGKWDEAVPRLRDLVSETPDHQGAAGVAMPLADHLAQEEAIESRVEALALYRRVATRAPATEVGRRAGELASELLRELPADTRRPLRAVPVADRFAEADAYLRSNMHREAERAFAAIARDHRRNDEVRCQAENGQGRALLLQRKRDEGSTLLQRVAQRCEDADIKAWARYRAARALGRLNKRQEAVGEYELLEQESPTHRLADDALFRAAIIEHHAGNDEGMLERLALLPERYPNGDMRGEARFVVAFHHIRHGDAAKALETLDAGDDDPEDHTEGMHGRREYWRARALHGLSRNDEAKSAYVELIEAWPLSYYAQQSLARLAALDADRAEAIRAAMSEDEQPQLRFPIRDEMSSPAFVATLELLRVGAIEHARDELSHLGATSEGADPDMLWLSAALFSEAGAHPLVTQLVRRRLRSFRTTTPTGRNRLLWRLAYPKAYSPLIETHAEAAEVPPAFVRAIAREESSFDARAESWAHAYGLVQLILPTARHWGRSLEVSINPQTLRQPEVNLAVGTRYMAYLRGRYEANPALVPAAYNAGHGAVDRWLREMDDEPLDVFVEAIPYDETRRYTRRVLQTWGIYSWLDNGRLPELPTALRADE